jgi:hypothetical protein
VLRDVILLPTNQDVNLHDTEIAIFAAAEKICALDALIARRYPRRMQSLVNATLALAGKGMFAVKLITWDAIHRARWRSLGAYRDRDGAMQVARLMVDSLRQGHCNGASSLMVLARGGRVRIPSPAPRV